MALPKADNIQLTDVEKFFNIKRFTKGDVPVKCPFHQDNNPSASLNYTKQVFKCHSKSCGEGLSLKRLANKILLFNKGGTTSGIISSHYQKGSSHETYPTPTKLYDIEKTDGWDAIERKKKSRKLTSVPSDSPATKIVSISDTVVKKLAAQEFKRRKFTLPFIKKHVDITYSSGSNGIIIFTSPNANLACAKLLHGTGLRYQNKEFNKNSEFKSLFPLKTYNPKSSVVWLVEGIFDALALKAVGIENPIALLTSNVSEENLFPLRGKTVFICLDSDYAGWNGTKELLKVLTDLDCNAIALSSLHFANDPSDAYANHNKEFKLWINRQHNQFSLDDSGYISSFVKGEERPLQIITTGIKLLDAYYGGGFKDGVHLIASEPGVGKTSFVCFWSTLYKLRGKRKLLCTYEIPKSQYWARNASVHSEYPWNKIELDPTIIKPDTRKWLTQVSKRLRIVTGWNVQKIRHVAKDFDVIIIDYLQRMPSPIARGLDPSGRAALEYNIEMLANLARDLGKVIIVVSSLSRMGQFRGSGVIEFIVQSAAFLRGIEDDDKEFNIELLNDPSLKNKRRIIWDIEKNTRGMIGKINLEADLGHVKFEEM